MAKDLAREIGYIYIDSGAMYRAVTLYSLENGIFEGEQIDTDRLRKEIGQLKITFKLNAETGRPDTYLDGVNVEGKIRTMEVSSHVSPVAALDFVREAMVAQQQEMGKEKGIVMDGRDIGTTVFPDAELKVFVTASPEVRAQRRYDELKEKGQPASYEEILENVKQRDYIDQHRAVSPLRKADDALLLDNSHLSIEEQKAWLMEQYKRVVGASAAAGEEGKDIRWLQRYVNFHRANKRILEITESNRTPDDLSELEMEGLIQRFEYTFELGWKVLQDLLKYKGYEFMQGPNGTLQKALEDGLITDHDGWRRMAKAYTTTLCAYNEEDIAKIDGISRKLAEQIYSQLHGSDCA